MSQKQMQVKEFYQYLQAFNLVNTDCNKMCNINLKYDIFIKCKMILRIKEVKSLAYVSIVSKMS